MKLSRKEARTLVILAIIGIYQLCSWVYQGYCYVSEQEDKYYEMRQSR